MSLTKKFVVKNVPTLSLTSVAGREREVGCNAIISV